MATVNYYSVFILTDLDEPLLSDNQGKVKLAHCTLYKVRMINHHPRLRCDATVQIDGKTIGSFRIEPGRMFTLERTSEVKKRLTFYKVDSEQGKVAGLHKDNPDLGKVTVEFAQERSFATRKLIFEAEGATDYDEVDGFNLTGGTGLSNTSTQSFTSVTEMPIRERFTINLLLALKEDIEPLR